MNTTLASTIWRHSENSLAGKALLAVGGTVLLALSAKVQVPFWPVPMTMQTFVVLILGIAYGSRLGASTGVLYLVAGAVGLPVFAKGAGIAYLIGPTGGYLIGFVIAMYVVGLLAEKHWDRSVTGIIGAMLIGEVIIFVLGVGWLATIIGFNKAIAGGLTPFLFAEFFKIALAASTVPFFWRYLTR